MKYNLIFQNLADATPRDANEARLITQVVVLYVQGMDFLDRARKALSSDEILYKDHWHKIFMNSATRLLELHNKILEAITRYRQQCRQEISVKYQHVTIQNGGKAVVSNVMQGG